MKLPDDYIEGLRQREDAVDEKKFATAEWMSDFWVESKDIMINNDKDYKWFVESSAASVGMGVRTAYKRLRVGLNVMQRKLHLGENSNLTHGHWDSLLSNTKKDKHGLIPLEVIEERLEWLHKETDKYYGQVPSTRDIADHYRKNGETPEHELCLKAMKRHAEKLLKCKVTRSMKAWAKKVIKDIDLYFENDCKTEE